MIGSFAARELMSLRIGRFAICWRQDSNEHPPIASQPALSIAVLRNSHRIGSIRGIPREKSFSAVTAFNPTQTFPSPAGWRSDSNRRNAVYEQHLQEIALHGAQQAECRTGLFPGC